jgi:8-oxo-dGTP pyrophosphatase MutT (NUDIX family)
MSRPVESATQYAALPYRRTAGGALEIMLITSRDTGRWIIPKGWPVPGLDASGSAAREAGEEAGLIGHIGAQSIGRFQYGKRLPDGSVTPCTVEVFPLAVERQLPAWREQHQRLTQWFTVPDAAAAVQEPELQAIIRSLTDHIA